MPDPSIACPSIHRDGTLVSSRTIQSDCNVDEIITSEASDIEKRGEQDQRASLFLGRPMSFAHEVAFFAVVATSNFTPRTYLSISHLVLSYLPSAHYLPFLVMATLIDLTNAFRFGVSSNTLHAADYRS